MLVVYVISVMVISTMMKMTRMMMMLTMVLIRQIFFYNRRKCLGKRIFDLRRTGANRYIRTTNFAPDDLKRPHLSDMSRENDISAPSKETGENKSYVCNDSMREEYFVRNVWLDLDVIDTTFLDNNTDALKHCFYNISREIVDDIRDVIVCGMRAEERVNRLDRRRGNVFCFRVAPRSVTRL